MSDASMVEERRPSTYGQEELLRKLVQELEDIGLDAYYGKEGYVKGVLKGNCDGSAIAFMAHVDTASDVMGNGVKAVVHDYEGGDIGLSGSVVIKAEENGDLSRYIGSKIITSDGSTLLGADDKAGIAIIMSAVKFLSENKDIKHPDIEVYFTSDEETGCGMDGFPYDVIKAEACYTVDGEEEGLIETECFNAASLTIKVRGNSIHFGSARGKLVNAITVLSHIISAIPQAESPEATDSRYGYYGVDSISGSVVEAEASMLIRDHDLDIFNRRIEAVKKIASSIGFIYKAEVDVDVRVSYYNMANVNSRNPKAVERIFSAASRLGICVKESLIRGGTDGARIAENAGISSPNIYTGGHNLHSLREWVALDAMNSAANLVLEIAKGMSTT